MQSLLSLFSNKRTVPVLIITIIILALLPTVYFYNKYRVAETSPQTTNAQVQQEVTSTIGEVGKLMLLPDENPTVATINDITQLKNQPFFANAMDGDKVLIYGVAGEAIIYRPSINRIVEVAHVNVNLGNSVSAGTQSGGLGPISVPLPK